MKLLPIALLATSFLAGAFSDFTFLSLALMFVASATTSYLILK